MTAGRATRETLELGPSEFRGTVLLVDDDPGILSAIYDFLSEQGYRVVVATNGVEALNQLGTGIRPDVILLDVMMPVMDGWDFRAELLADPALRDIPVVVITAAGFSPETIRHQLRARDVLSKPLDLCHFLRTLQEVCGGDDASRGTANSGS